MLRPVGSSTASVVQSAQFAARSKIVIIQLDGKTVKRIPFNYNKVVAGEQENFYLLNGDIILVP